MWPHPSRVCDWYDELELAEENPDSMFPYWCGDAESCDDPADARMLDYNLVARAMRENDCEYVETTQPDVRWYEGAVWCSRNESYTYYYCWQAAD